MDHLLSCMDPWHACTNLYHNHTFPIIYICEVCLIYSTYFCLSADGVCMVVSVEPSNVTSPAHNWAALKPFKCRYCVKRFKSKETRYKHEHYLCGKEPKYQCPYCNIKMKQKSNMTRHLLKIHNVKKINECF